MRFVRRTQSNQGRTKFRVKGDLEAQKSAIQCYTKQKEKILITHGLTPGF